MVAARITDGCDFNVVTAEHADLAVLGHVPDMGSAANCTSEKLCCFLVEQHSAWIRLMSLQNDPRFCVGEFPESNLVLIISSCQHHAILWANPCASKLSARSNLVLVLLVELLFLEILHLYN